ncbi:methylglyoxal synthase [Shimia sp.]|uniref:methylglyoxal synthase n=1 Tax=Shimia sp. TaxID=1954381 RepID=UPI0032979027
MSETPEKTLQIALVAHDACKETLVSWVGRHVAFFEAANIFATGTTGGLLKEHHPGLTVNAFKSGPLGGDQQIGALISEDKLDALFFFIDPMSPMPHDVDVKALTRLAIVYDIPMACSTATANCIVNYMSQSV